MSEPFVDGFIVPDLAVASSVLPFRPAAPTSLGTPIRVFLHRYYRPQAIGLVYDHALLGRFMVTEAPVNMPEALQRAALAEIAAACDPATGCVGSWTMHNLGTGNPALVIGGPQVTAVVWIHGGGVRFELLAPASSMTPVTALGLANIIEVAG